MEIKIEGTPEEVSMALKLLMQAENDHKKHVTVNNFLPEDSTGTVYKQFGVSVSGSEKAI